MYEYQLGKAFFSLFLFVIAFLWTPESTKAQITDLRFIGTVEYVDAQAFPIPNVTVNLKDANSNTILGTTMTDSSGNFEIRIPHTTNCTPTPAYRVELSSPIWTVNTSGGTKIGCLSPGYHTFGNLRMIRVLSVTFEDNYTDQLSNNPNAGLGRRIYPDKETLSDNPLINRRIVKVSAVITVPAAVATIYFKIFDPDDPSSNDVAVDANGSTADDNRGTDSNPQRNNIVSAQTNAGQFTKSIDFTVTMHPGDNFAIAASTNYDFLNTSVINGGTIQDSGGNTIEETSTQPRAGYRTQMLTVWRRLHIEVDSMGLVAGNTVTGTITNATQGMFDIQLTIDTSPEDNRFKPGIIVINNVGTFNVFQNAGNLVNIDANVTPSTLIGKSFELFDDDDFDENNNPNIGDMGEDVAETAAVFSKMQQSDNSSANLYAPAYIMPVYDGGGNTMNNTSNIQFQLNIPSNQNQAQINLGRNSGSNESDNYWVTYIQLGYQGGISVDRDPDVDPGIIDPGTDLGRTPVFGSADTIPGDCTGVPRGGDGSVIYLESVRDLFYVNYRDKDDGATVPHEVGHQFGLDGDETGQGLMSSDPKEGQTFIGSHLHILRCRVKSPGVL